MTNLEQYLRHQFAQVREGSDGIPRALTSLVIDQVTVPEVAEDPRMSYDIAITVDGLPAVITAIEDGDGETSGSFTEVEALSERLQVPTDYLEGLANAIWWAAGDAIFLSGLKEPTTALQQLGESLRSAWGIGVT